VTWRDLHLWQIQPVRDVLLIVAVVGLFWLGDKISLVTVPLLLAILLAYLFEPVIALLEARTKLGRPVVVAGLLVGFILFVVVPTVVGVVLGAVQAASLLTGTAQRVGMVFQSVRAPDDAEAMRRLTEDAGPAWVLIRDQLVEKASRGDTELVLGVLQQRLSEGASSLVGTTASAGLSVARSLAGFVGGIFAIAFGAFLTGFFFYFVSTGWVALRGVASDALPRRHRARIIELGGRFDAVVSGFVRGRLTIAFVQAVVFSIAYWLIGVPAAFLLGPAVAILSIVPYLALVGIPVSVALLWLEGHAGVRGQWWWVLGAPLVVYFVGQALDDYLLTPVIQGKSTNMDTPTILFATLAGVTLFGVFGMLIAIPIAACVKILVVEILWPRVREWLEGRARDPLPIESEQTA
jgi:predicted PurR-regulated permease PerM